MAYAKFIKPVETQILKVSSRTPEKKIIKRASRAIKNGEIVAFPTETVYGLGANAFCASAVRKIFHAKGRPSDNPLIVHISGMEMLEEVARNIPEEARVLAKKFWPGPLTLVLKKQKNITSVATGGGSTVAVRVPKNKIALALVRETGVPIAAPSANLSTRPSPTHASHVLEDFNGKIPLILDGGPARIGIESTVLDLTSPKPTVLRSGKVSQREIEKVLKKKIFVGTYHKKGKVKSPGQKYRHYAPSAMLIFAKSGKKTIRAYLKKHSGEKIYIITFEENKRVYKGANVFVLGKKRNLDQATRKFFAIVRKCDSEEAGTILVDAIPEKGIGTALLDRVRRAATKII